MQWVESECFHPDVPLYSQSAIMSNAEDYEMCNTMCKKVARVFRTVQQEKIQLNAYELPSHVPTLPMIVKTIDFTMAVKSTFPLYLNHNVSFVRVFIPLDGMRNRDDSGNVIEGVLPQTIAITLVDINGNHITSHPWVLDARRFDNVGELMMFLDKLAHA